MRFLPILAMVATAAFACNKNQQPSPKEPKPNQLLSVGATAPSVDAVAHDGRPVKTSELIGKPYIVYFYPRDETPGCTAEAQAFRDDYSKATTLGATIIGVSTDSIESHRAFAENHKLPFPLLADGDRAIAKAFGVDTSGGYAKRVTFVIGADGKIANVFPDVTVANHSTEVLDALTNLSTPTR